MLQSEWHVLFTLVPTTPPDFRLLFFLLVDLHGPSFRRIFATTSCSAPLIASERIEPLDDRNECVYFSSTAGVFEDGSSAGRSFMILPDPRLASCPPLIRYIGVVFRILVCIIRNKLDGRL
jgi:hypothetical protein